MGTSVTLPFLQLNTRPCIDANLLQLQVTCQFVLNLTQLYLSHIQKFLHTWQPYKPRLPVWKFVLQVWKKKLEDFSLELHVRQIWNRKPGFEASYTIPVLIPGFFLMFCFLDWPWQNCWGRRLKVGCTILGYCTVILSWLSPTSCSKQCGSCLVCCCSSDLQHNWVHHYWLGHVIQIVAEWLHSHNQVNVATLTADSCWVFLHGRRQYGTKFWGVLWWAKLQWNLYVVVLVTIRYRLACAVPTRSS